LDLFPVGLFEGTKSDTGSMRLGIKLETSTNIEERAGFIRSPKKAFSATQR
jgi:hypothetical protein